MTKTGFLEEFKKLKAIADTGLLYSRNDYDKERYTELQAMAFRLLSQISGHEADALRSSFPTAADYPTAKVDIRGLILSPAKKILLIKESIDSRWSLPGGWADVGCSPKETVVK